MNFLHSKETYNERSANEILPFIKSLVNPKSMLDVGCGLGTWLAVAKSTGISDITGIENTINKELIKIDINNIHKLDINYNFDLDRKFDLVLCLEVAEHLNQNSSDNLINSLTLHADNILFSAAIPQQGGDGHINEQFPNYWIEKFQSKGYYVYDVIRTTFWNNENVDWWYKQNMFLFSKENLSKIDDNSDKLFIHPYLFYDRTKYALELQSKLNNLLVGKGSIIFYLKLLIKSIMYKIRQNK